MSYCRWSSNDFLCDLYCYESSQGFETHVAGNKPVGEIPKTGGFPKPDAPKEEWAAFADRMNAQHKWLDGCERKPIGLAFDGESFTDPDLESFLQRLLDLRAAGYDFPDYVIEDVREEISAAASPEKAPLSSSEAPTDP